MANNKGTYPFKRNGYIYSKGTAAGFERMKRMGIPRPMFADENKMKKLLLKRYKALLVRILSEFKQRAIAAGIDIKQTGLTKDGEDESLNSLLDFFEQMKQEEEKAMEMQKEAELRAKVQSVTSTLQSDWTDEFFFDETMETEDLEKVLEKDQDNYLARLFTDSEDLTQKIKSFSINKETLYNSNMSELRRLYLDNCKLRMHTDEEYLKRLFLQRLYDYATGKSDKLNVKDVTDDLYHDTLTMSQFFARDQLARFNKATTLATFTSAGVTKVKWVTTHDVRVRDSHKALDGKIFNINALPQEIHDYNCRCGLVPVEWADD